MSLANSVLQQSKSLKSVELHSSLPLQISLYYNVHFAPLLFVASLSCLWLKYPYLPTTFQVILAAVYLVYYVVEVVRLALAYYGNLGEKIPALSGFWITSLVLQLPIVVYLQLDPNVLPLPLERAIFLIHLIFLVSQLVLGVIAIRTVAAYQIRYFMALLEEDIRAEVMNGKQHD